MKLLKKCLTLFLFLLSQKHYAQCTAIINTFPFKEGFETGTANWVSGGVNNDWAWGSPSKTTINSAGAGSKCWITGGLVSSFYNFGERSWVESPCFDFTSLDRPFLSFLIFWDTERTYDGGNIQYSSDGGATWSNVGSMNSSNPCTDQNWFTNSSIINLNGLVNSAQGWSGTVKPSSGSCSGGGGSGTWKLATRCIKTLANKPQVKFRFTFGSGTTCNDYDGLAFDDFTITNAPDFPVDFEITCTGGSSVSVKELFPNCHTYWDWDFGDTASLNNLSSSVNSSHLFSTGGNFLVTLKTGGNCSADTQLVKQVKILSALTNATPVSCQGSSDGKAEIQVQNPGMGLSYSWSNNPTLNSNLNNNVAVGDYSVTLMEPGSCDRTFTVSITNGPGAFPNVSLGGDTTICSGSQVILFPGYFRSYKWQDNSTDSNYIVKKAGIYSVTISNSSGCNATDSITIVEDCINDIIIPNSFTPNGDGSNEVFNVLGSQTELYKILVFNRWGELIFKSEDRSLGWDGQYKGKLAQEGIYNYIVTYDIDGTTKSKTGSVFLFR